MFACDITFGSFCGLTAFSVMSFGLLATCVCGATWKSESLHLNESWGGVKERINLTVEVWAGCFLMYFSVLLLDTKQLEQKEASLWDVDQEESLGLIQWMHVATPLLSLLVFLLTAGLVAGSPHHHTGISIWTHVRHCKMKVRVDDKRVSKKSDKSILLLACQRCTVRKLCDPGSHFILSEESDASWLVLSQGLWPWETLPQSGGCPEALSKLKRRTSLQWQTDKLTN